MHNTVSTEHSGASQGNAHYGRKHDNQQHLFPFEVNRIDLSWDVSFQFKESSPETDGMFNTKRNIYS